MPATSVHAHMHVARFPHLGLHASMLRWPERLEARSKALSTTGKARRVQGGATRGSHRKLSLAAAALLSVGFAFALLVTAAQLSKAPAEGAPSGAGVRRDSAAYWTFLAVWAAILLEGLM